jgi:hypothetical protein
VEIIYIALSLLGMPLIDKISAPWKGVLMGSEEKTKIW